MSFELIKNRVSQGKGELNPQFEGLKLIQSSGNALVLLQIQIYSTAIIFIQRSLQALLSPGACSDKFIPQQFVSDSLLT